MRVWRCYSGEEKVIMATITNIKIVNRLIAGNGRIDQEDSPDNPWCIKIVEYTNAWGDTAYGLIFEDEDLNKYTASKFVNSPKTLWERK